VKTRIKIAVFVICHSSRLYNNVIMIYFNLYIVNEKKDQVTEGMRCDFELGWCGWTNTVTA